jgi:DNA-binding response OmpR family regulator
LSTITAAPVVLIAEDDEDIRDLISWKLELAGYRTLHAGDGKAALALAHEHRPDAVVLDIGMPEMDGLDVCRHLQQHTSTTGIPVLLLSGRTHDRDIELGHAAGADDYMIKPFNPQDLLHRVNDLLAGA